MTLDEARDEVAMATVLDGRERVLVSREALRALLEAEVLAREAVAAAIGRSLAFSLQNEVWRGWSDDVVRLLAGAQLTGSAWLAVPAFLELSEQAQVGLGERVKVALK